MKILRQATTATLLLVCTFSCSKETVSSLASESEKSITTVAALPSLHQIGEFYEGGYIFYLDSSNQHGLIAAPENQSPKDNITWNSGNYTVTGAVNSEIGGGIDNTKKIIAALGTSGSYAALLCVNYKSGGYSDWFLPSKAELLTLSYVQRYVPNLTGGNYWSSTETDANKAWIVHFHRSLLGSVNKGGLYHVRAVRRF